MYQVFPCQVSSFSVQGAKWSVLEVGSRSEFLGVSIDGIHAFPMAHFIETHGIIIIIRYHEITFQAAFRFQPTLHLIHEQAAHALLAKGRLHS